MMNTNLIDEYSKSTFVLYGSQEDRSVFLPIKNSGGIWEPHISNIIHRLINSGDTCIDIGANIGVFSLIMSNYAKAGHVHAFEPSPLNYDYLRKNIEANHCTNVKLYELGLCDKTKRMPFYSLPDVPGASFGGDTVPTKDIGSLVHAGIGYSFSYKTDIVQFSTLDEWVDKHNVGRVHLIKMDVEGNENSVIQGGRKFFEKQKPKLISEFNIKAMKSYFGLDPEIYYNTLSSIYRYIHIIDESGSLHRVNCYSDITSRLTNDKFWLDILCTETEEPVKSSCAPLCIETDKIYTPAIHNKKQTVSPKKRIVYFTVAPLVVNNGGSVVCKNNIFRLSQLQDTDLTIVVAGPHAFADESKAFALSLGCNGEYISFIEENINANKLKYMFMHDQERLSLVHANVDRDFKSIIDKLSPDLIVLDYLFSAFYIPSIFKLDVPRIMITLNREAEFFSDRRRIGEVSGPRLLSWITGIRLAYLEKWFYSHCAGVVALSKNDLPTYLPYFVEREVISPILDECSDRWTYSGSADIFFVGNIAHYPNRLAMEWICEQLAPEIEKLDKKIKFHLIGASANDAPQSWNRPSVELLGVSDAQKVEHLFKNCALFIAPIANNFGSKMKLLECLSYGTPFIATRGAMSGLPFLESEAELVLNDVAVSARTVVKMINNPKALTSMSAINSEKAANFREIHKNQWGLFLNRVIEKTINRH